MENLPMSPNVPLPPFTNVVLNFTICTCGHRDVHDKGLCAIFPLGNFEREDLVLYEASLVVPLKSCDFSVFNSQCA